MELHSALSNSSDFDLKLRREVRYQTSKLTSLTRFSVQQRLNDTCVNFQKVFSKDTMTHAFIFKKCSAMTHALIFKQCSAMTHVLIFK